MFPGKEIWAKPFFSSLSLHKFQQHGIVMPYVVDSYSLKSGS
jgi:hypothetical protein